MANDVTTLTLAVDTTDVKTASQTLGQMAQAGNSAAAATIKLEQANAAMVAELKRIGAGVSELVKLTAAEGRAAQAVNVRSKASAAAALSSTKAAAALRDEAKAVEKLAPAATISAGAMQKLSLSSAAINTSGVEKLTSDLSAAATQANRTAQAVNSIKSTATASSSPVQQSTRNINAEANRAARDAEREASRVAREAAANQRTTERQAAAAAIEARANARATARSDKDTESTKTREAAKATRDLAEAQKAQAKAAGNATFKNQQLGFQLHDFFVQVASGQSPITAFVQQGSQLSGTFGGAGNAFRAVLGLLSPAKIAFGALAATVGTLAFAFYDGTRQSKAFADAIVLSGNYAGQTEGKFNALTKAVENSTTATVGQARDAALAIAATGEIGPRVFEQATQAATLYAKATGQTAQEVASDFARMTRAPSKWAEEHNRALNFVTAEQYESIKAFEEQGRAADAQGIIFDALSARLKQLDGNLGFFDRQLIEHNKFWSDFWHTLSGTGRAVTAEEELRKIESALQQAEDRQAQFKSRGISNPNGLNSGFSKQVADLEKQRLDASKRVLREQNNAFEEANKREQEKAAITADSVIDGYLKRGKAATTYKQKLDELNRSFDAKEHANVPVSEPDKKVAREQLKKDFTNPETSQILKAQLDRDIKSIQDILNQEKDAFAFNERFLQGQYQAGQKSLQDYYDARRDLSTQGIQAEIATLEAENNKLAEFRKKAKDPSERIQAGTRIDENTAQIARLRAQGIREQDLLNQEATASFKQLDESVANYNATLEQLLGNEEKAASIRASIAIQNARVLSSQKGGSVIDVKAYEQALNIQNQFNSVQQRTSAISAAARTAEETFAEAAEQRGLSQRDTETGIYQIRKAELEQLGELAKKAKELADILGTPANKQAAAELALAFAKAAKAVDPALDRLKQANKELAQSIADSITNLPKTFGDAYSRRRQESFDDIKNQKQEYNQRIDQLEQYLAESSDKQDKARLRERIKKLQEERDSTKRESKASSFFKTLGETVLAPIGQQVLSTITKVSVSDPLQKMLENSLNSLTTGDGVIGKFFKDAFGVKDDPLATAQSAQAISVQTATTAIDAFREAIIAASAAIPGGATAATGESSANPFALPPVDSELSGDVNDFGDTIIAANDSSKDLAKTVPAVTNVLGRLAGVTSNASSALSILPSIISLISSTAGASSASSAGGGIFGVIASAFGGSGGSSGAMSNELFHDGGIVGQPTMRRITASNVFAGATKYHRGGIAGLQPDEVPAILMGGAKGKREEILTAKDPRHRDNLLNPANRPYMTGQHSAGNKQTTNNKNQVINQEFHFNTGGAPVDRRTAQMVGAAAFRQTSIANKRYN